LPGAASLTRTTEIVREIERIALDTPGIIKVAAFAGFSGATRTQAGNAAALFPVFEEPEHRIKKGLTANSIIGELLIANENQKKPCIVILSERDKIEMEDDIRSKFPSTKNTRIICRSGNPLDLDDLAVVDPHSARSIIVLAPETENPDIHVIKSVLAITNNPARKKEPYHVVAEIRDAKNLEAAALVGGKEAIYVQGEDLIARVTAQTCRQSGLSVVYTELLDFDGAEIYFKAEPALAGRTYREIISAYEDSTVMGLMRANGEVLINPPMEPGASSADRRTVAPGSMGTTAMFANVFYWIEKDNDLTPHIGHRVEIEGDTKGDVKKGEMKIERKDSWTEIEVKSNGKEMKARVPNASILPGPKDDKKIDQAVLHTDNSTPFSDVVAVIGTQDIVFGEIDR